MASPLRKEEAADDWLSNFNDLSIEEETKTAPKKDAKPSRKEREISEFQEKEQAQGKAANSEANSFEGLKAKLGFAASDKPSETLKDAALDDISSRALEGIPKDAKDVKAAKDVMVAKAAKSMDHASNNVRKTYESLLESLLTDPVLAPTKDELPKIPELKRKNKEKVFKFNEDWPGRKRLTPSSAKGKEAEASSTGAVDNIQISGGVVSPSAKSRENSEQQVDMHYGKPVSIATKARIVRERPKWGGMTSAPEKESPSFKASFDSLQRADKISATPQRPSTAFSAQPWGFKGSPPSDGFADSPGELAAGQGSGTSVTRPAHEETDAPQSGSFSGMLGFKKLRDMLYGAKSETKTDAVEQEGTNAPSIEALDDKSNEECRQTMDGQTEALSREDPSSTDLHEAVEQEQANTSSSPQPKPKSRQVLRRQREKAAAHAALIAESVEAGRQRKKAKADRHAALLARAHENREAQAAEKASRASEKAVTPGKKAVEAGNTPQLGVPTEDENATPQEAGILDSSLQAPESDGRSMSEAMVGRDFADAMTSEHDSYEDDSRSGLPMIEAKDLQITALNIEQPSVPGLSFGLDRVLFNPGVTPLQDQHSRIYNFDPYLQNIMPVQEFDFNALQQYKTSSQDSALSQLAKAHNKKYVGSTSSMTSTLSHFHYLLSGWRDLNLGMLSRQFPEERPTFTAINRAPTAIFLRWKDGTYAIDADKEHDSGNVLMMLGKSMEKLLTMSRSDYERYRKSDPREITEEERNAPEAYEYTTMGDFLMRSQLDAYDPRLPGNGMFDIKTRAIASIRMSTTDYKPMLGYEILTQQGEWESYEREYYDMMRSTMLKYMLQARMGRMDGIFLAYHNVERIFGFQYMPISEIDRAIHGQIDRCLGDQEFKVSVDMLNKVLEEATAKFPNKSLRLHFETRAAPVTAMYVFAEPMEEEQIDEIQSKSKEKIAEFERKMMGIETKEDTASAQKDDVPDVATAAPPLEPGSHAPLYAATILAGSLVNRQRVQRPEHLKPNDDWTVEYLLKEMDDPAAAWATYAQCKAKRSQTFSHAVTTDDEGGAEVPEDFEPNFEMHENDGSVRTFENFYLEKLRKLAEKGRQFRNSMDKLEKDQVKVVYGAPATKNVPEVDQTSTQQQAPVEAAVSPEEPIISSVEEYMSWMYANKENQAPAKSADTIPAKLTA